MTAGKLLGYILMLGAGILGGLAWYTFGHLSDLTLVKVYVSPLVFLVLLLTIVFVALFLFDDFVAFVVLALIPLSYLAYFHVGGPYITAATATLLLFLIGMRRSILMKRDMLHLSFSRVSWMNSGFVGLGIVILLLGLVYGGLTTLDSIAVPEQFFEYSLKYTRPVLAWMLPGITPESTVDDFLSLQILGQAGARIPVSGLPADVQEEITKKRALTESGEVDLEKVRNDKPFFRRVSQPLIDYTKARQENTLKTQRDVLSADFRVGKLQGNETLGEFVYLVINRYVLDNARGEHKTYVLLGLMVAGFFILKSLFWIFTFVAIILGSLILYGLRSFNVVRLERVTVEKEILIV